MFGAWLKLSPLIKFCFNAVVTLLLGFFSILSYDVFKLLSIVFHLIIPEDKLNGSAFYLMFLTLIQCLRFKTENSYFYWNIVEGFELPH